eukprot:4527668-Amphidinium_carterae.1
MDLALRQKYLHACVVGSSRPTENLIVSTAITLHVQALRGHVRSCRLDKHHNITSRTGNRREQEEQTVHNSLARTTLAHHMRAADAAVVARPHRGTCSPRQPRHYFYAPNVPIDGIAQDM